MTQEIRERLIKMSEEDYKNFSKSLIPDSKPLLGVRLFKIRELANELADNECTILKQYSSEQDLYFEEVMLRGMLIGRKTAKEKNIKEALILFDEFVPLIDNWSVCDSFCNSMTVFSIFRAEVWEHIQKYIYSQKEFEVRTALIIMLTQFLKYDKNGKKIKRRRSVNMEDILGKSVQEKGEYTEKIYEVLDRPFTQGYYAQMAAAWLTAESFIMYPYSTVCFLKKCKFDTFTYNKAIAKICESKNPSPEVKQWIRKQSKTEWRKR